MRKTSKSRSRRSLASWLFGSTQWERRGASIVEVMISVAIVVISALAAASFFADQSSTARNISRRSACQAALDAQLTYFRQSPASQALAWSQEGATAPMTPIVSNESWFDDSVVTRSVVGQEIAPPSSGTNARLFKMQLLQQGSMGLLGQILHNVPNVCSTGVDLSTIKHKGTSAFPASVDQTLLKNFKATLQVQPYDLISGQVDSSCPLTWARPQGQMDHSLAAANPPIVSMPPDTSAKIGYRVSLTGTYDSTNGPATCSASDDFSYPVDTRPPKASVILNYFDPSVDANSISPPVAMVPPKGRPECSHNSGGVPAAVRMEIGFNAATGLGKIEPGTMFLCRDVSQQVNGDYCPGAPGAHMKGQTYNPVNAPWVPCGKVTACGLPPSRSTFSRNPSTGEQKYVLNYETPNPAQNAPDGLWGCDVKIDVATVDPSGNYTLLSSVANPLNASFDATKGKYFQPVNCWACYKKKSSLFGAIIAFVAITVFAGLVGAAIFCATGGGGICRPNHTKFLGNSCFDKYGSGGSKFCRKVPTQYPDWFGHVAAKCPAVTAAYPAPHGNMSYSFPVTSDGGVAEDSAVDKSAATFCEAQAICVNGSWQGFPQEGSSAPGSITDCGSIYTQHKLSIAATPVGARPPTTGPQQCFTYIPDSAASHVAVTGANYYQSFTNCPSFVTGLSQNVLCTYTFSGGHYHANYPVDARLATPNNKDPNNYYYYNIDKPLDLTLPECTM